jgi:hypothetical protein
MMRRDLKNSKDKSSSTNKERLAAALRENLRRRKLQARGRAVSGGKPAGETATTGGGSRSS